MARVGNVFCWKLANVNISGGWCARWQEETDLYSMGHMNNWDRFKVVQLWGPHVVRMDSSLG